MTDRLVLRDYNTPRLNGGGPAMWVAGDVVDLNDDDASWVNRDAPGTLDDDGDSVASGKGADGGPSSLGDHASAAGGKGADGLTETEREADEQAAKARAAKTTRRKGTAR